MNLIHLAQDKDKWWAVSCKRCNKPSSSIKCREFLDYLRNGYLLKTDSAACSKTYEILCLHWKHLGSFVNCAKFLRKIYFTHPEFRQCWITTSLFYFLQLYSVSSSLIHFLDINGDGSTFRCTDDWPREEQRKARRSVHTVVSSNVDTR